MLHSFPFQAGCFQNLPALTYPLVLFVSRKNTVQEEGEVTMKKILFVLAIFTMLFAVHIAGCCFGDPEEGRFCFIIIPIPGADSGSMGPDVTFEQVDCALVR